MDQFAGEYPYTMGIKTLDKPACKVGDMVLYDGHLLKILRIDGHVYPICLGGGIRVTMDMVEIPLQD